MLKDHGMTEVTAHLCEPLNDLIFVELANLDSRLAAILSDFLDVSSMKSIPHRPMYRRTLKFLISM